jgi:hypothetical protein
MPTLLIEEHVYDHREVNRMGYAAQELGMDVQIINAKTKDLPKPATFFGSLNFIKQLQTRPDCPTLWCDWHKLSCQGYYPYWGKDLVQQRYAFYPFAEVVRLKDELYEMFGVNNRMFIRPDSNDKTFTGAVIEKDYYKVWEKNARTYNTKDDTLCVVSRPEVIKKEFRMIVANGKVITGSLYSEGGLLTENGFPKAAADLIEASKWHPHPLYVADVALTDDGFKLMEIGPINGAGIYKCDVVPILKAVLEILP